MKVQFNSNDISACADSIHWRAQHLAHGEAKFNHVLQSSPRIYPHWSVKTSPDTTKGRANHTARRRDRLQGFGPPKPESA
ncbi:MAG: hypothetical protein AAGC95_05465 [Pseudomonadota bacterium]